MTNDPRGAEDRLRDALTGRANAARPSPHALDGVFGKVARHRRNVRVAAAAGTALSIAAVAVVASAAVRTPGERGDLAASPTPAVTTEAPTPTPSASPSPSATPTQPPDPRAIAAVKDGRIVEVSATTGKVVREITVWRGADVKSLAWSPDRASLVVATQDDDADCTMTLLDAATGRRRADLGRGRDPVFSPDGSRIAFGTCPDPNGPWRGGFEVMKLAEAPRSTWFEPPPSRSPGGQQDLDAISAVWSVAWRDAAHVVVARTYEGSIESLLVNVDTADSLADGQKMGIEPDQVAANGTTLAWTTWCCPFPDSKGPSTLHWKRGGGAATKGYTHPVQIRDLAVTATGSFVFVDERGLWTSSGTGTPALVLHDAVATAT